MTDLRQRERKVSILKLILFSTREHDGWCASRAHDTPSVAAVALAHERLYLEKLPSASMYERSYMHRDVVTHLSVARWVSTAVVLAGLV